MHEGNLRRAKATSCGYTMQIAWVDCPAKTHDEGYRRGGLEERSEASVSGRRYYAALGQGFYRAAGLDVIAFQMITGA
jgi:hypothetical protein